MRNLTEISLKNRALIWYFILVTAIGGIFFYFKLGRMEDPNFTIKQGSASNRDEEGGRSVLWVVVAGIAILAMIAAAVVAGYILITNKPGKKGGKFAK